MIVLDKASDMERVIERWREIGVTGATVLPSLGVGSTTLYGTDAPVIANLRRIFEADSRTYNHTMLSVIKTEQTLKDAIKVAEDTCGDFKKPNVGIMFTVKIDNVIGFMATEKPDGG